MIGILNIAGHQRKLLSLTTSYSKTVCKKGYPDSLPIAHFFKVSFLTEEGDDFFADWMYGRNKNYPSLKGQWYNGTIIFYDETSYGQEFLQYELTAALATNFRVDYDQEKGMVTTLEIFATERIYNHKFIINSKYYAITFDYVKVKGKIQQLLNDEPEVIAKYYTDLEGNRIEETIIGEEVYLVLETKNMIGKTVDIDLSDNTKDFEYEGQVLEDDILVNLTINGNIQQEKLKVIPQQK